MKPDPRQIVTDRPLRFQWTALLILTLLLVLGGSYLYGRVAGSAAGMLFDDLSLVWVIAVLFLLIVAKGIYTNQPNQAVVASLFGRYVGTDGHTGLRFSNQEVGIRAIHYSNAGIKQPNDGVEAYSLHYRVSF